MFQFFLEDWFILAFFGALIAVSTIMLYLVFASLKGISKEYKDIEDYENISRVNLEYFVVYIIPFLGVQLFSLPSILGLLFLFGIMGFMYVRTDSIYMNPMFAILGLNLFRITSEGEQYVLLVNRKHKMIKHQSEAIKRLTSGVWIEL